MVKGILLSLKLNIEVTVLLLSVSKDGLLVINLVSQVSDEDQVAINSSLVVIIYSSLLLIKFVELVFKVEKLILESFVVSFSLSEFNRFLL